jgi:hypothetical protein
MMTAVASKIKHMKPGSVFPINSLAIDPARKNAVEKELSRLVEKGELQRFRRGVYYKPAKSAFFGNVLPNPTEVANAIARLSNAKMIPYGPMALHMLGLTTQVPMKQVYLNDKLHKTEMVGNTPIVFKRVSPKKLLGAGKKAGLVLSALEYIGKEEAQDEKLQSEIAKKLNSKEKLELEKAAKAYPKWLREIVERIVA